MRNKILTIALATFMAVSPTSYIACAEELDSSGVATEEVSLGDDLSEGGDIVDAKPDLVYLNEFNFPDANFRAYLSEGYDADGDCVIRTSEVDSISVAGREINSLQGIELFENLEVLYCVDNNLTNLDVSQNTKLTRLYCRNNNLTKLDVSKNVALEILDCEDNNISNLDFTNNKKLTLVNMDYDSVEQVIMSDSISVVNLKTQAGYDKLDLSKYVGFDYSLIKDDGWDAENKTLSYTSLDFYPNADIYVYCVDMSDYEHGLYIRSDKAVGANYENISPASVTYRTHVQSYGWQGYVSNGVFSGTQGKAKRLEAIDIKVAGNDNLGIQYTTHCQSYGWLPWSANGEMNGTEGEAKRLEAIEIQLTGADKDKYDVYYRVHAQSYGWLGWAKNGIPAGTAGYAKRLEGIQIIVVRKGERFDTHMENIYSTEYTPYIAIEGSSPVVGGENTDALNPVVIGEETTNVAYKTHVQSYGWQGWKYNGAMSGTSGQSKRLEGINIKLTNKQYSGGIAYTTHVQSYGWQGNINNISTWKKDGEMAGTTGEAKRLEAICIALTGEMAEHYDVYYRVHAQSYGWLGWAKNGAPAGTAGYSKRLEGIQIVLVPKGGTAPADNYGGVVTNNTNPYISK